VRFTLMKPIGDRTASAIISGMQEITTWRCFTLIDIDHHRLPSQFLEIILTEC